MSRVKGTGAVVLAIGIAAAPVLAHVAKADVPHQPHTPGTFFGTLVSTSTGAFSVASEANVVDYSTFRLLYDHPLETLTDEVSERAPRTPATFFLA
jgi:hypothetical protein